MAKHKKHPEHEEHPDESWLVPYADVLTLLLALFIVLFASSSVDKEKYNAVMEAFYHEFTGQEIPGSSGGEVPDYYFPQYPDITTSVKPTVSPDFGRPDEDGEGVSGEDIGSLLTALQGYVSDNALENTVSVELLGENILITLKNDVCFESGSRQITEKMQGKIAILAQILQENQNEERPFEVIIAGHTDNVPMADPNYTNWDLSADRALECLRLILRDTDLDPAYFSIRGYGELQPLTSNDTADGRMKNRRVEVLISQPIVRDEYEVIMG